jgi:carbamoyltransferase
MFTLGINAVYHDSSACLVQDGEIVAAAEEERFTHVKHGKRPVPFSTYELPYHAIDYCLREAGINLTEVDHVAYSYDPYLLLGKHRDDVVITLPLEPSAHPTEGESPWEPLFLSYIVNAPRQLADGAPHHLRRRFEGARHDGPYRWHFVEHHLAHEASAFLAAPFDETAVLTMDGRGEQATTTYGHYGGGEFRRIGQVNLPHSLGLLYESITRHLGFKHSADEYKVMALAPFGTPRYVREFARILQWQGDGCYQVTAANLTELFGPARAPGAPFELRHCDVASSLQAALEETVLEMSDWLHRATGSEDLCMAGGVALNCVMNAKLRDHGPFKRVWVQPAAGDAGTALGAALWIDFSERGGPRPALMEHAYLGPGFSAEEIEAFLHGSKVSYRRLGNIAREAADLLTQDQVLGWFQGRMEFGPRALGARSILASPINAAMQARLNAIKDREDFRPVAPVVLEEEVERWFVNGNISPYMLFVFDVIAEKAARIPAVRHVDGTARIQTVNRTQNPLYYDLIRAFAACTGVPVLVNTSFNTRGEPIVCTPRDALECFWTSPLDALVIGPFLIEKRGGQ